MQHTQTQQQEWAETIKRDSSTRSLYGGYNNSYYNTRKPVWQVLQDKLLSERDLKAINAERLQYTQLLYRWGGHGRKSVCCGQEIAYPKSWQASPAAMCVEGDCGVRTYASSGPLATQP